MKKRYNMRAKNWPLRKPKPVTRRSLRIIAVPPRQWMVSGYVKQPHPARSQVDVNINLKIKHD
ncbi:hypothetical protein NUKP16_01840 [Klebsiella quasipneumoniae]|nr:hypothetical protein NUKP16_01840 [Klebsiella quasipneumoniae]